MIKEGEIIGGYRVCRLLGTGGMAEVYEVEHLGLRKRLAMKVFVGEGKHAALLRERFLAEGRLLSRIDHPHVVKAYDLGGDDLNERAYYTLDLHLDADGNPATVENECRRHAVTESRVRDWYADVREALLFIHAQGLVHRDVKPSNLLLDAQGRARLSDFGVVRFSGALKEELAIETTFVTGLDARHAAIMGTYRYLAPEVQAGGVATPAADMWALGMTVFRLLTGIDYVPQTNAFKLLAHYDPCWRRIVPRLLDPDPEKRTMPELESGSSWKGARQWAAAFAIFLVGAGMGWAGGRMSGSVPDEPGEVDVDALVDRAFEIPDWIQ